jgi:hypothetical protein
MLLKFGKTGCLQETAFVQIRHHAVNVIAKQDIATKVLGKRVLDIDNIVAAIELAGNKKLRRREPRSRLRGRVDRCTAGPGAQQERHRRNGVLEVPWGASIPQTLGSVNASLLPTHPFPLQSWHCHATNSAEAEN